MSNPLTDFIPARHRKAVYALAFIASLAASTYAATGGDWRAAVVPFLTALSSALSYSNVTSQ